MSEVLRFHRWPMWTLGSQSGVMVGSPRRLKASLEPSRQGSECGSQRGPARQRRGRKERKGPHLP